MALHEIQVPPEPPAAKPRPRLEEVEPQPARSSSGPGIRTAGPWRPGPASAWRSPHTAAPAPGEHTP